MALAVVRSLELLRAPWVGEALLLGRFDGSCATLEGEAEAAEVGARAKCRGEGWRTGAREDEVVDGGAATAVVIMVKGAAEFGVVVGDSRY